MKNRGNSVVVTLTPFTLKWILFFLNRSSNTRLRLVAVTCAQSPPRTIGFLIRPKKILAAYCRQYGVFWLTSRQDAPILSTLFRGCLFCFLCYRSQSSRLLRQIKRFSSYEKTLLKVTLRQAPS